MIARNAAISLLILFLSLLMVFPFEVSADSLTPPFEVSRVFIFENVYSNSPILSKGEIIYTSVVLQGKVESYVVAFHAKNGSLLWNFKVESFVWSALAMGDDAVYFATHDGECYALSIITGEAVWSCNLTGMSDTGIEDIQPVAADGLVYFGTRFKPGYLYALNATTGELAWKFPVGVYSMVAGDRMVYVTNQMGEVHAIDTNGSLKWQSEEFVRLASLNNDMLYATGAWDNSLLALDAKNGTLVWSFGVQKMKVVALNEGLIYTYGRSGDQPALYALNMKTGTLEQKTQLDVKKVYRPYCLANGIFYGWLSSESTRYLTAFSVATGELLWSYPLNQTTGGTNGEGKVCEEGSFLASESFICCSAWEVLEWGDEEEGMHAEKTATIYIIFDESQDWWSDARSKELCYIEERDINGWVKIQVLWSNAPVTVMTNSTVGRVSFDQDSQEILIEVAGIDGTQGFMNITTPSSFVPMPSDIKLYLDSQPIDFNFTQKDSYNVAELTYHHSTREIAIKLPLREAGTLPQRSSVNFDSTLPSTFPYQWTIAAIVVSILGVVVLLLILVKRGRG